ncbi:alkaline phosphatase [Lewinella sp. LCG006]|uniref:alkaline phosphatase n=1 Tax=Lewinella sp. LCG006 TaxID=3231911 RepID=UPI00345F50B5
MIKWTIAFLTAICCLASACEASKPTTVTSNSTTTVSRAPILKPDQRPKNIILMVGDGMGLTQITAGLYSNGNQLNLERFPVIGLHKSYSSDNLVTDSAAGATAFSTGQKTYNGAIGVDNDSTALYTILEEAEANGLATGMVSTSTIVHATPASFIAHQAQRSYYEPIAADFLKTDIDLFIGGGKKYFDRRADERNLLTELKAKGYQVSHYFEQPLDRVNINYQTNFVYLTSDSDPLTVEQGRNYLKPASIIACDFLNKHVKDKGFFLMIEGAQIDWGGHANNSQYIITEMIDFDNAIGAVLDFAARDGNTLVIVTADHETGGYAINPGSTHDSIIGAFTSDYHTAALIPVFAYGPGSKLFSGIYENTEIYYKMREAFGFGNKTASE